MAGPPAPAACRGDQECHFRRCDPLPVRGGLCRDPGPFFRCGGLRQVLDTSGSCFTSAQPWLLLAGWLHYLAFDLFVGAWEVRTAHKDGIAHLAIVPSLLLTFMVGPAGFLVFTVTRLLLRKQRS